ncbi:MAG: hypothetical protein NXH88_01785 [Hyphomonas sp.]|nr:hypothetical protein [Hyphomonas sp.]
MARRYSASQIRSKLRQSQNKLRQASNKLKQDIRRIESEARRQDQKRRQAINNLNSAIRTYNSRARANRQRLTTANTRLKSQTTIRYKIARQSAVSLKTTYDQLEHIATTRELGDQYNELLDYSERETANSLEIYNALEADDDFSPDADPKEASLIQHLQQFSNDFSDRWRGAVYALSPHNPDASRHFCTSVREIFISMIDLCAPNSKVLAADPDCPIHQGSTPTRRAKFDYMLSMHGLNEPTLGDFVERDIDDILQLLGELNSATHGAAGKFSLGQLSKLRKRVRDGLEFLSVIGKPAFSRV